MLRTALVGAVMSLALVLLAPVAVLATWVAGSPWPLYRLAVPCVQLLLWLGGVRSHVAGREQLDSSQNYLFVANHRSNVDPPLLLIAIGRDIRALGKASLFRLPVFGWVLRTAGFVPIHRGDRERSFAAVDEAAAALANGHDFLVFGEGTRSRDGSLLPFKKGPFVMAIKAAVPVVPVAVSGTDSLQPKGSLRIRPGNAAVRFLAPIPTAGLSLEDRTELRDTVRHRIAVALAAADCNAGEPKLP